LTFDTETTTDTGQALRVGAYQLHKRGRLREEGLFYEPDTLGADELETVTVYAAEHGLLSRTRDEFAEGVFLMTAWDRRGLVVGHNLPFDVARIAIAHGPCQSQDKAMRGGFSHTISTDPKRSHVQVKRINAGGAFIRLTIPAGVNPEIRNRERGGRTPNHHGYFLDTATLAAAILGKRGSLKDLGKLLHTATRKTEAAHGEQITPEYLDYMRTDVQVTWECWQALQERYATYQLPTPPWKIYSEASIGKSHLDKSGLTPFRALNDWPGPVLATVLETYYGGRAECRIRRVAVPGVYVDFKSQYPTVFCLQKLWRYLTAEEVTYRYETPHQVQRLLNGIDVNDVLDRRLWPTLDALVLIPPNGDRLPTRARYTRRATRRDQKHRPNNLNVGVPFRSGGPAQWWTLADCIASVLMTGKAPRVVKVLRFEAQGTQDGLTPIDIAGKPAYRVDPINDDPIRRLVELRADVRTEEKAAKDDPVLAAVLGATQTGMKSTANGTSYGSPIELNPIEHRKPQWVTVHLPDGNSYHTQVNRTEQPGKWFHPLIATLVAGAGRLLLASAMRLVADQGGDYAFCDTDSLFIVATETGGFIPCPGEPHHTPDGAPAITALSWQQVQTIVERFASLNPYNTITGSILEIEDENYDPDTRQQRQIECYAIASKRYGLFTREPDGKPVLVRSGPKLKRSEHGLGFLHPPLR
jgi:hypothetical protein